MTYTQNQILEKVRAHYRLLNHGNPNPLIGGLTPEQHEIIGNIMCALKEPEQRRYPQLNARVKSQYQRA